MDATISVLEKYRVNKEGTFNIHGRYIQYLLDKGLLHHSQMSAVHLILVNTDNKTINIVRRGVGVIPAKIRKHICWFANTIYGELTDISKT